MKVLLYNERLNKITLLYIIQENVLRLEQL